MLLDCGNGVLRVTTTKIELVPHSADYGFTLKTAVNYDERSKCERFWATLEFALADMEDRHLFRTAMRNVLLPANRHEVALVAHGPAGTGKSTIAEAAAAALGGKLVTRLTMSQLCDPKGYHVPKLRHAALNLGTELDSLEVEDGGSFKALVSGEAIQCRPIYGSPFVMASTAKLIFLANDLPRFKNGTDGELRRMRLIRFDARPSVPDVELKSKLLAERDGIFREMVSGLQTLLRTKTIPYGRAISQTSLARFTTNNDPIAAFVSECCVLDQSSRLTKWVIQEVFNTFCEENGLPVALQDSFLKRLYARFTSVQQCKPRVNGIRVPSVQGLRLKDDEE